MPNISSTLALIEFKEKIKEEGLNRHIEVILYLENDNELEINEINSISQSKGYASKTLKLLGDVCDKYKVDLSLRVAPLINSYENYNDISEDLKEKNSKSLNEKQLISWYERNGFEMIDSSKNLMIRKNNKKQKTVKKNKPI